MNIPLDAISQLTEGRSERPVEPPPYYLAFDPDQEWPDLWLAVGPEMRKSMDSFRAAFALLTDHSAERGDVLGCAGFPVQEGRRLYWTFEIFDSHGKRDQQKPLGETPAIAALAAPGDQE